MDEIRNNSHLMDIVNKELENDKVYEFVTKKGLDKEVFNQSLFDNVLMDVPYLTSDFEKLHCTDEESPDFLCKPSVMRQFVKDLNSYLNVSHIGRTVTIDYMGFIKLKMVLVLRKSGMKPSIILDLTKKSYGSVHVIDEMTNSNTIEQSNKQELRNKFIDSLISHSLSNGTLQAVGGEFIFEGLFESNNNTDKLDDTARMRERELLSEMYKGYGSIKNSTSIEEMEKILLELKDKYHALEAESVDIEGYLLRAEEFIEAKKILQIKLEVQHIENDALSATNEQEVKSIIERFEQLELKYKELSEYVTIAKSKWIKHIEVMNMNNEVANFELHMVDVLSDIAQGKYLRKESLSKIAELEEEMKKLPRINMGLKISLINTKKDLETGFFKRIFR